ncbi:PH domain-containing protein [Demequina sp. B12]|uniref:PH domain-containing protein n=1 Tax=Demequina sp. B12 TaxID=2992757 RepID=UPI00237AB47F|nr:PH domain-containing protein [Demequina sp. B12]MDE0573676.1 PH domain-containing protein [Demequina sp. B12]
MNDPFVVNPQPGLVFRAPREWTRLHPVSPLLGGWAVMGAVVAIAAYNILPEWLGGSDAVKDTVSYIWGSILWVAVGVLLLIGIVIAMGYAQWRVNEYRLSDTAVEERKGILMKQHRQARLDRLQAVDVVQPLLARIFGFASLKIEVAGGAESGIELQFMRLGDAEAMRNELLALAAGVKRAKAQGLDASVDAVVAGAGVAPGAPFPGADAMGTQAPVVQTPDGHVPRDDSSGAATYAAAGSLRDVARPFERGVAEVAETPEREIYHVEVKRLLMSIVLSAGFWWMLSIPVIVIISIIVAGGGSLTALLAATGGGLVAILPAVLAVGGYAWNELNSGFNFRAALSEDGIRLRHGLTETRRQTLPPGRIQAVKFKQGLLWRKRDWWKVTINVAGYQDEAEKVSTLLPVGDRQDALTALWMVLPDLGDPDPAGTVSLALSGTGEDGGFTGVPQRARLFDPLQWRNRGVRATDRALFIRRGWLTREVCVVPHERTQSLGISQGPLQRARHVADVQVHSTNGPVRPVARHLDVEDAVALLDAQAARAAEGRKHQTPEQWMSAVGLRD